MSTKEYTNGKYTGDLKELKNGEMRHGKGVMKWADGSSYDGEWNQDKMTGQGKFNWPNGDECEGKWRDDLQEG